MAKKKKDKKDKKKVKKSYKRTRDAVTGKLVKAKEAKRHPKTTVTETVKLVPKLRKGQKVEYKKKVYKVVETQVGAATVPALEPMSRTTGRNLPRPFWRG